MTPSTLPWVTLELRWRTHRPQRQLLSVYRHLNELGSDIAQWHHLWLAKGGMHLRLRVQCGSVERISSVSRHLAACAPSSRQIDYAPEIHKFGGPSCIHAYEQWFHASSVRAAQALKPGIGSPLKAALADLRGLMALLPPEHQEARTAMMTFAQARISAYSSAADRVIRALGSPSAVNWLASPSVLIPPAAMCPHDHVASTLQLMHQHANRLALTLTEEALIYLALVQLGSCSEVVQPESLISDPDP